MDAERAKVHRELSQCAYTRSPRLRKAGMTEETVDTSGQRCDDDDDDDDDDDEDDDDDKDDDDDDDDDGDGDGDGDGD
eukprot:2660643-Rhodomonas_salina.1